MPEPDHHLDGGFFNEFFNTPAGASRIDPMRQLLAAVRSALADDGEDRTANAVFPPEKTGVAVIVCKEAGLVVGLPLVPIIMEEALNTYPPSRRGAMPGWRWEAMAAEGGLAENGRAVARIEGPVCLLLKAERVILNFITHLSGVANLTARYASALEAMQEKAKQPYRRRTRLLDTRKTLPGLRFPEKYAVRMGGGENHRLTLEDMLMLKDNHIDAAGSIAEAVSMLRRAYSPCPPVEVECRTLPEVRQAIEARADRIMLDNMDVPMMREALKMIPADIESEISGGITMDNLRLLQALHPEAPDFVSVGRITHSAPSADFSMRML